MEIGVTVKELMEFPGIRKHSSLGRSKHSAAGKFCLLAGFGNNIANVFKPYFQCYLPI